jgi:hypothetical protein
MPCEWLDLYSGFIAMIGNDVLSSIGYINIAKTYVDVRFCRMNVALSMYI